MHHCQYNQPSVKGWADFSTHAKSTSAQVWTPRRTGRRQVAQVEGLARRVHAVEDRKRPRANPDDDRDGARPRAKHEEVVEMNRRQRANHIRNLRARSEATETGLQRDVHNTARGSLDRTSSSGVYMNSLVTNEHYDRIVNTVLNELDLAERKNLTEESIRFGLNPGYALDLTPMDLSSELVQTK